MTVTERVMVLVLDSLRVDAFTPSNAPNLSRRVSQNWLTYDNTFSTAPWTLPAHASIFTGCLSREHTATAHSKNLPDNHQTLAENFVSRGYETRLVTNNPFLSSAFGMTRGFGKVSLNLDMKLFPDDEGLWIEEQFEQADGWSEALQLLASESTLKTPINLIYKYLTINFDKIGPVDNGAHRAIHHYLSSPPQSPEFVCFNFMEPHIPYHPPEPYKSEYAPDGYSTQDLNDVNQEPWDFLLGKHDTDFEALQALYEGEIAYLDKQLEHLFTTLEEEGRLDEMLIVVCGDHGDHFGEHGFQGHVGSLHRELLHVPLFIKFPGGKHGGLTIEDTVSLRQLFTSLIEWTGGTPPEDDSIRESLPTPETKNNGTQGAVAEYLGVQDLDVPDEGLEKFDYRRTTVLSGDSNLIETGDEFEYHEGTIDIQELRRLKENLLSSVPDNLQGLEDDRRELPGIVKDRLEATGYIQ